MKTRITLFAHGGQTAPEQGAAGNTTHLNALSL